MQIPRDSRRRKRKGAAGFIATATAPLLAAWKLATTTLPPAR
jgi:hypothetical protein